MTFSEEALNDLDTFFNSDEFGVLALYGSVEVVVVLWNGYKPTALYDFQVDNTDPYAIGKASDFADAKKNETLIIGGITYYIDPQPPDGTGVIHLNLSRSRHG